MTSQSLKTDTNLTPEQELVWKKLSTVKRTVTIDIEQRALRGTKKGEVTVFAAHSGVGKSFITAEMHRAYEKLLKERTI